MRRCLVVCSLSLLILLSASALADDFFPAPFRGQPLSVFVEWDFITDFNPDRFNIVPDAMTTVGGGAHVFDSAFTHAHASDTVFWTTDPGDPNDGRAETFELPGQIDFFIANWIDLFEFKTIQVQITYGGQGVPWVSSVVGPNATTGTWTDPTYGWPDQIFP